MTTKKHVMLDIETLGKGSFAAIISIGAVKFNPFEYPATVEDLVASVDSFHIRVAGFGMEFGLQTDASTIEWWMSEERREARNAFLALPGVRLHEALDGFAQWFGEDPNTPVWGNGATFDNVIVTNAYGRCGLERPWSYKSDRCFRTIKNLTPDIPFTDVGVTHGALDDALAQAWQLQRIVYNRGLHYL